MAKSTDLRPVLSLLLLALSGCMDFPASCQTPHAGAKVTNFGDGIVMYRYEDQSGFVITTAGSKFRYDAPNKTMIYESVGGASKIVKFSEPRK